MSVVLSADETCLEKYEFLVSTHHVDVENGLLYYVK